VIDALQLKSGEESPDAWVRNSSTGTQRALREPLRRIECLHFMQRIRSARSKEEGTCRRANHLGEGRTPGKKGKSPNASTNVLIEDGKAKRENIHVSFHDVSPRIPDAEAACWCGPEARTVNG